MANQGLTTPIWKCQTCLGRQPPAPQTPGIEPPTPYPPGSAQTTQLKVRSLAGPCRSRSSSWQSFCAPQTTQPAGIICSSPHRSDGSVAQRLQFWAPPRSQRPCPLQIFPLAGANTFTNSLQKRKLSKADQVRISVWV